MADSQEVTQAILSAWDDDEETPVGQTQEEILPPPTPPPPAEEPEQDEDEEEIPAEEEPEAEEEEETPQEDEEEEQAEEEEEESDEGRVITADYDDPEIQAFLAKYQGDVEKGLKGAAELARAFGRQGSELAAMRQRTAELEQAILEAQAFQGGTPLNEEQRNWAEEAASSVNPGAYIRQAMQEGQFDLARAVCREWARENPYEATRAGQFIDMQEAQAYAPAPGVEASTDQVLDALASQSPELAQWYPQMAKVADSLGQNHPLVQEAKSSNADTAMRGIIGLYEIARASTASVQGQKEEIKKRSRQAADGARRSAAVSSATSSPKSTETPRPRQIMPGLTMDQLDTEFAQP